MVYLILFYFFEIMAFLLYIYIYSYEISFLFISLIEGTFLLKNILLYIDEKLADILNFSSF